MPTIESDRFQARSANGNIYTVIEHQNIIEMRMLDGTTQRAKGTRSLYLSNGQSVNHIDENTFQIVETDEIIRRVE
ncbi:hypothetical protein [Mesorhizobium sp. Mes31]|uniref:hypothetical protein n=1 Tax=Mesorhizobium sp. Mes31 TaxID=2926017 RepID=UPI0021174028|nr:hypothetical protein [Mesorhizobium sp. Mes31]